MLSIQPNRDFDRLADEIINQVHQKIGFLQGGRLIKVDKHMTGDERQRVAVFTKGLKKLWVQVSQAVSSKYKSYTLGSKVAVALNGFLRYCYNQEWLNLEKGLSKEEESQIGSDYFLLDHLVHMNSVEEILKCLASDRHVGVTNSLQAREKVEQVNALLSRHHIDDEAVQEDFAKLVHEISNESSRVNSSSLSSNSSSEGLHRLASSFPSTPSSRVTFSSSSASSASLPPVVSLSGSNASSSTLSSSSSSVPSSVRSETQQSDQSQFSSSSASAAFFCSPHSTHHLQTASSSVSHFDVSDNQVAFLMLEPQFSPPQTSPLSDHDSLSGLSSSSGISTSSPLRRHESSSARCSSSSSGHDDHAEHVQPTPTFVVRTLSSSASPSPSHRSSVLPDSHLSSSSASSSSSTSNREHHARQLGLGPSSDFNDLPQGFSQERLHSKLFDDKWKQWREDTENKVIDFRGLYSEGASTLSVKEGTDDRSKQCILGDGKDAWDQQKSHIVRYDVIFSNRDSPSSPSVVTYTSLWVQKGRDARGEHNPHELEIFLTKNTDADIEMGIRRGCQLAHAAGYQYVDIDKVIQKIRAEEQARWTWICHHLAMGCGLFGIRIGKTTISTSSDLDQFLNRAFPMMSQASVVNSASRSSSHPSSSSSVPSSSISSRMSSESCSSSSSYSAQHRVG